MKTCLWIIFFVGTILSMNVWADDPQAADVRPQVTEQQNVGTKETALRNRLHASLDHKIELVDWICDLSDAQTQKLLLAGRGDIKRFIDGRVQNAEPIESDADVNRAMKVARRIFDDDSL